MSFPHTQIRLRLTSFEEDEALIQHLEQYLHRQKIMSLIQTMNFGQQFFVHSRIDKVNAAWTQDFELFTFVSHRMDKYLDVKIMNLEWISDFLGALNL